MGKCLEGGRQWSGLVEQRDGQVCVAGDPFARERLVQLDVLLAQLAQVLLHLRDRARGRLVLLRLLHSTTLSTILLFYYITILLF